MAALGVAPNEIFLCTMLSFWAIIRAILVQAALVLSKAYTRKTRLITQKLSMEQFHLVPPNVAHTAQKDE